MSSKFTRYWKRIDNTPGSLDRINPTQFRELKKMVKEAFHAGQRESQKHIAELEAALREIGRLIRNNVVGVYDEDRRHWMGIDKELRAILAKYKEQDDG